MKSRKIIGILLCSVIILSGSAMVFAGDNEEKAAITLWFSIYVLLQLERNFQQGSDSSLGYYSTWPLNTTLHEQGYLRTGKNLGCIRKYSGGNIKILYSVFTLNST